MMFSSVVNVECRLACTEKLEFCLALLGALGDWYRDPTIFFLQIYRPINDTWQAVSSLGGDIGGGRSKNLFSGNNF